MTPHAPRSPWVRDEVNAALNQVRKGRMRGVIPVVAQSCADADIPPLWDPLHRYDATRTYDAALSGLLRALGLAESAVPAPSSTVSPSVPSGLSQSPRVTVAEPMEGALVVDAGGKGHYRTIAEAVKAASPGDRILVRAGHYTESISIEKSVALVGEDTRTVVIEGRTGAFDQAACILVKARGVHLAKLSLRQPATGLLSAQNCCLWVNWGGEARVEDCDFTTAQAGSASGVNTGGGSLTLHRGRIHDCKGNGVTLDNSKARLLLEDTVIEGCSKSALYVKSGVATVRRSQFKNNGEWGVRVDAGASGTFEDNDLRGNGRGAWSIAASSPLHVQRARNQE